MNRIKWSGRREDYRVIIIHRGLPNDQKEIDFTDIEEIGPRSFTLKDGTIIPFHRVLKIVNVRTGEVAWEKLKRQP